VLLVVCACVRVPCVRTAGSSSAAPAATPSSMSTEDRHSETGCTSVPLRFNERTVAWVRSDRTPAIRNWPFMPWFSLRIAI
jgi:hypothetical protein